VTWPGRLASLNDVLTVYIADDGLIRREDYDVEILDGASGPHHLFGYAEVDGIMVPTGHRILPRMPDGQVLTEPLLISVDLTEIKLM
jgi:hypothetical protein